MDNVDNPSYILDLVWIFSVNFIFLINSGVILSESGSIRVSYSYKIPIKNLLVLLVSTLGYSLFGYRLMFGYTLNGIIGYPFILGPKHYGISWQFCHSAIAGTVTTISLGGIAGRSQIKANMIIAFCIAALVYPINAHWVWGGGWLHNIWNIHDAAGGGGICFIIGIVSLIGARIVQPRKEKHYVSKGQNFNLVFLGLIFIMVGSAIGLGSTVESVESLKYFTFYISIYFIAILGGIFISLLKDMIISIKRCTFIVNPSDLISIISGSVAGILAGIDLISSLLDGFLIGIAAGSITYLFAKFIRFLDIDDPVGISAPSIGGGVLGVLLVTNFSLESTLRGQLIYLLSIGIFTYISMTLLYIKLDKWGWLRLKESQRILDLNFTSYFQDSMDSNRTEHLLTTLFMTFSVIVTLFVILNAK